MRKLVLCTLIGSALIMMLCSCGSQRTSVSYVRLSTTGIEPKQAVVIMLNLYSKHDENIESESEEKNVEACITEALNEQSPKLKTLSVGDFRKTFFPGVSFKNVPRSPEALRSFFNNEKQRRQAANLGIRYLVVVNLYTSDSIGKWGVEGQYKAIAITRKCT
jgi:hypothetical protein